MYVVIVKGNAFIARRLEKGEYRSVFYWSFKENTLKEIRIGFAWLKRGMMPHRVFAEITTKNGGEPVFHTKMTRDICIIGVRPGKLFFDGFF